MPPLKITYVEPIERTGLCFKLSNNKLLTVNLETLLTAPGYEVLHDAGLFKTVQVEEWGHGVEWPALDIGISVETLVRLEREQAGRAVPVQTFNDWMQRNHLSLAAAADALGITRRTVIYYHCGHKPIPLYIGLACEGWEARKRAGRSSTLRRGRSLPNSLQCTVA